MDKKQEQTKQELNWSKQQESKISRQNKLEEKQKQFSRNKTPSTSLALATQTARETNNNDITFAADPRIESIAKVLKQHSRLKLKQLSSGDKKGPETDKKPSTNGVSPPPSSESASGSVVGSAPPSQAGSPTIFKFQRQVTSANGNANIVTTTTSTANCPNQVDQGNSYLYAYNDFVTSPSSTRKPARGLASEQSPQEILSLLLPPPPPSSSSTNLAGAFQSLHPFADQFHPQSQPQQLKLKQESLIESDEDDALSYILHQHQHQHQLASSLAEGFPSNAGCLHQQLVGENPPRSYNQSSSYQQQQQSELSSRIEHHLSCSRSSHPRHICGIGGGKNERLSNIAARLKEESERAFILNQRSSRPLNSSSQFLETTPSNRQNQQQAFLQSQEIIVKGAGSGELILLPAGAEHSAHSSSSGSERNIVEEPLTLSYQQQARRRKLTNQAIQTPGYFAWLICCLSNLLGLKSSSERSREVVEFGRSRNRRGKRKQRAANGAKESILNMYTSSNQQQQQQQMSGQMGAYYASGQAAHEGLQYASANVQSNGNLLSAANLKHHHHHHHHHHLASQQQHLSSHFQGSSDSSLGSSGPFGATSCLSRLGGTFRQCCSKKCLFVSCLILIIMIFILVIGLSAYLNFLINLNKVNLSPLSGRLKVETLGDQFNEQLLNKTSKEFLAKQQQYETILRGALDRTQPFLKSYPNHLVKLEVYSFKPGSLWIYFRLFINKKTLMSDSMLMKRKSPDELLERQFLPRLTQQTLHSGFELLMSSNSSGGPEVGGAEGGRSRSSRGSPSQQSQQRQRPQQQASQIKSFDEQISRLMPIIESIDLQSIQVTPEFDMLQALESLQEPHSVSDNLRAPSQFLSPTTTTTSSSVLVATGNGSSFERLPEYEIGSSTSADGLRSRPSATTELSPSGTTEELSVSTNKFTLSNYKENATRPSANRPQVAVRKEQQSVFLVEQQHQKRPADSIPIVRLASGQQLAGKPANKSASEQEERDGRQAGASQMLAPYQKSDSSSPKSIQELWSSALSKKNVTMKNEASGPKKIVSVSSSSSTSANQQREPPLFSSEVSETIRAQIVSNSNKQAAATTNKPAAATSVPTTPTTPARQKVSPHLKHAAIISAPSQPARQEPDSMLQSVTSSAIVLNRDAQPSSPANQGQPQVSAAKLLQQSSGLNQTRPSSIDSSNKQTLAVARKPSRQQSGNSNQAANLNHTSAVTQSDKPARSSKPPIKKVKKTALLEQSRLNATGSTGVSQPAPASATSKGIRIVDNFLASIDASKANKSERFNFNSDTIAPTLPTTIELVRSTTSSSASTTSGAPSTSSVGALNPEVLARAPTKPVAPTGAPDGGADTPTLLSLSGQLNRPGTSSFSNQWRPLSSLALDNNRTARRPNVSLIVVERLPGSLSVEGSQSPFAMSPAILEEQLLKPMAPVPRLRSNRLSNGQPQAASGGGRSSGGAGNEFESRRVSRMRQNVSSERTAESSSAQSSFVASSTTSASVSVTDSNTRMVDDFVITTDRIERASLPALVAAMHQLEPIALLKTAEPLGPSPRRTRGPFAFESLKSGDSGKQELAAETSARLERSPQDSSLLLRKKLFLGAPEEASAAGEEEEEPSGGDKFGRRRRLFGHSSHPDNNNTNFRCHYYGCKAKSTLKFVCLNYTQLCDDFIDCQDESDELDCVSLLQHDSKQSKLSFSNGAGIIYLNRKGSLAPMCIDYFGDSNSAGQAKKQQELIRQINTIGQYACSLQSFSRLVSVKINHNALVDSMELIKSSRLFHRLSIVSQAERRQAGELPAEETATADPSYGSYRSGTPEHEVEISTSGECPSQRTVFVKCGGFECGQDSFSVMSATLGGGQNGSREAPKKLAGGVVINDFPWLVKLYWLGKLSCHGYLVDDLWLVSSQECFANKSSPAEAGQQQATSGWTAEISYEHYGNHDYQSIESNMRAIKELVISSDSPIVLAKLEKPVRFSPLNRPICLPPSSLPANKTRTFAGLDTSGDLNRSYKDCVTATLSPRRPPNSQATQQQSTDLLLSKVKVHKSGKDCFDSEGENGFEDRSRRDVICVTELNGEEQAEGWQSQENQARDETHVLICSGNQHSRAKSKWTLVGVESISSRLNRLDQRRRLFTSLASQIDWIVETMNPRTQNGQLTTSTEGLQEQPCDRFKCSSGECLSFSRICDGLYDCSSQDDEKDCHK